MEAILGHYNGLPETAGGRFAPVYYYLDIFAVNLVSVASPWGLNGVSLGFKALEALLNPQLQPCNPVGTCA